MVVTDMQKKNHGQVTFCPIEHGTFDHRWTGRQMGRTLLSVCLLHVLVVLTIIRRVCAYVHTRKENARCGIREERRCRRRARKKK